MDPANDGIRSAISSIPPTKSQLRSARSFTKQYKCQPCRKAKQKCLPEDRIWPAQCDSCNKKEVQCSAPMLPNGVAATSGEVPTMPDVEFDIAGKCSACTHCFLVSTIPNVCTGIVKPPFDDHGLPFSDMNGKRPASIELINVGKYQRRGSSKGNQSPYTEESNAMETHIGSLPSPLVADALPTRISMLLSTFPTVVGDRPDTSSSRRSEIRASTSVDRNLWISHPYSKKQHRKMKAAADLLATLGQLELAFFVNMKLFYSLRGQHQALRSCLPALIAASRSVTNKPDAEVVSQLLHGIHKRLVWGLQPLLDTMNIRVCAATLSGIEYTGERAAMWKAQVHAVLSQYNVNEVARKDFDLKQCATWTVVTVESTPSYFTRPTAVSRQIISPQLLTECVIALEYEIKSYHREQTPSGLAQRTRRIDILHEALLKYSPRSIFRVLGEVNPFILPRIFKGLTFAQRVHLTIYLHIRQDLSKNFRCPEHAQDIPECDPGNSIASLAGSILELLTYGAAPVPSAWLDREPGGTLEKWINTVNLRYEDLKLFSHEILASWMNRITKNPAPVLTFPKGSVLEIVKHTTGIEIQNMDLFSPKIPIESNIESLTTSSPDAASLVEKSPLNGSPVGDSPDSQQECASLYAPSIASSSTSMSSSFRAFKKVRSLRRSANSMSQEMLPPSSVIRSSLKSDWSLNWDDTMSDLSGRLSKSSLSLRESSISRNDTPDIEVSLEENIERPDVREPFDVIEGSTA